MKSTPRKPIVSFAILGLLFIGSTLYAIVGLPFFPHHAAVKESVPQPAVLPVIFNAERPAIPDELNWFFIAYPDVAPTSKMRIKNRHTYVISDSARSRDYVVLLAQSQRRVEIYFSQSKGNSTVEIFTPGKKRTVSMHLGAVVAEITTDADNHWMFKTPLWNSTHLRIYKMADFWRDSPYTKYSCAGFVHRFLQDAGVTVPLKDAWDMAKLPYQRISLAEMEPGDIITIRAASAEHRRFWHHAVTHVGVYLGEGKLIHASTSSPVSRRSYVRIGELQQFQGRIDKVLRPPELN